jgi:hypothetical protein
MDPAVRLMRSVCLMRIVEPTQLDLESNEETQFEERPRSLVQDPIPDPEPATPSLGHPDPGVFHHSPSPVTWPPFNKPA